MKIFRINSQKIITEKFLKSKMWEAPITGPVTLRGTGKGFDAQKYILNQKYSFRDLRNHFLGGIYSEPTTHKYFVEKGEVYQIWLANMDGQLPPNPNDYSMTSLNCVFDKQISLGTFHIGKPMTFLYRSQPNRIESYKIGELISVKQNSSSRKNNSLEPANGMNGSGLGGVGFSGKILVMEMNEFKVIDIQEQSGLGGSGFLEISYPSKTSPFFFIENNFLAKNDEPMSVSLI